MRSENTLGLVAALCEQGRENLYEIACAINCPGSSRELHCVVVVCIFYLHDQWDLIETSSHIVGSKQAIINRMTDHAADEFSKLI